MTTVAATTIAWLHVAAVPAEFVKVTTAPVSAPAFRFEAAAVPAAVLAPVNWTLAFEV